MADLKSVLRPYDLEKALAADRGGDCLVIDVGRNDKGETVPSLQRVTEEVDHFIQHAPTPTFAAKKLYIIGEWNLTPAEVNDEAASQAEKIETRADGVTKWAEATQKIGELIVQMGSLQELTWISGLPFTATLWESIPTLFTKLILDLGEPVRLEQDGDVLHKSYITPDEMKLLQEQVKLKELRLFRVHNSFQPLVWETIFRNTSEGGMRILDLQMAAAPIVRSEQWKKAKDVAGLTVSLEDSEEKGYKGMDGKGVLNYLIGTGEYLDDYCIRKARIASGLSEATPLPLWCLKLDGFVIDHLPFENELSSIVLLMCGEDCIDSGLRAPRTERAPQNEWSKAVNNATSHCLVKWPNWIGVFNESGNQRDKLGLVIPPDLVYSTPLEEFSLMSPTVPLTKESLKMKELNEALGGVKKSNSHDASTLLGEPAISETPVSVLSNKSERGSDVPTPTADSSVTAHSPRLAAMDGTDLAATFSFGSSDANTVGSPDETLSPISTMSSFEQVDEPTSGTASNTATTGSDTATEENTTPKKTTFAHRWGKTDGGGFIFA